MVQLAVLARLLDPVQFGLAASTMLVVGFANQLSEAGITNAIIAKQTTDRDVLSSLYWANILIGVAFAVALIASIPMVTAYFGEAGLAALMLLAAPALIIAPFGQLYGAVLAKELSFRPLAGIEMVSSVAGAAVAITAAALGAGAAAIICGFLTQSATRATWLAIRGWRAVPPRMHLRRRDLDGYLSFGAYQMGERTANYVGSNLDYALIGGFLSQGALGIYSVAFRLITIPQLRLNPILTRVAYPVFAKRQDDNRALQRGFLELTTMVALVAFPIMAGLAVTAPRFIPVVFGPQWTESVPILQILSVLGALFALGNLNGSVFLAKDRPDLGLKLNLLRMAIIGVAFPVAIDGGLKAIAWSFLGVAVLMMFVLRAVLGRLIDLTLADYLSALSRPTLLTVGMAATVLAATPVLAAVLGGNWAVLVAQVAVGVFAYLAFGWIFARGEVRAVIRMIALGRHQPKNASPRNDDSQPALPPG
jgi:O-antigen/teichoic acid export membrane protein